jgi:hypothetical protein
MNSLFNPGDLVSFPVEYKFNSAKVMGKLMAKAISKNRKSPPDPEKAKVSLSHIHVGIIYEVIEFVNGQFVYNGVVRTCKWKIKDDMFIEPHNVFTYFSYRHKDNVPVTMIKKLDKFPNAHPGIKSMFVLEGCMCPDPKVRNIAGLIRKTINGAL